MLGTMLLLLVFSDVKAGEKPGWRNRQTRQVEGLVWLIPSAGSTPVPGNYELEEEFQKR